MESLRSSQSEDEFTKSLEKYTAAVPSTGYLAVAMGAIGLSLACQVTGRGKWGNFIAQWVPTWLIIGIYNKLVELEGHDASDRRFTRADEVNATKSIDLVKAAAPFERLEEAAREHVWMEISAS